MKALFFLVAVTLLACSSGGNNCIPSGDQADINAALAEEGDKATLCANATFALTTPVQFTADSQELYTEGYPTSSTRATLRVTGTNQDNAIVMEDYDDVVLRNIIIDGNRTNLGVIEGGDALIMAGGSSSGQIIKEIEAYEPRGWSILHLFEGNNIVGDPDTCTNATVEDNDLGPAGNLAGDNWADGISFSCTNSIVRNNTVTDTTDGAIVIFGAPGSRIANNTIRATSRKALGGINMVDYGPYDGNYNGTVVTGNTVDASGALIRIGMAMGGRVWGCPDDGEATLTGATVTNNTLTGDNMGYGFVIDGVSDWTVTGNSSGATHSGDTGNGCDGTATDSPTDFLMHGSHAAGTFQDEFEEKFGEGALWPPSGTL